LKIKKRESVGRAGPGVSREEGERSMKNLDIMNTWKARKTARRVNERYSGPLDSKLLLKPLSVSVGVAKGEMKDKVAPSEALYKHKWSSLRQVTRRSSDHAGGDGENKERTQTSRLVSL